MTPPLQCYNMASSHQSVFVSPWNILLVKPHVSQLITVAIYIQTCQQKHFLWSFFKINSLVLKLTKTSQKSENWPLTCHQQFEIGTHKCHKNYGNPTSSNGTKYLLQFPVECMRVYGVSGHKQCRVFLWKSRKKIDNKLVPSCLRLLFYKPSNNDWKRQTYYIIVCCL